AKVLRLRMLAHHQREQFDQALCIQVLIRVASIQILLVIGAIRPQDVQTLASATDADLESLSGQQPAVENHLHPVHRMYAIEEVASPGLLPDCGFVFLVLGDELLLFVLVSLEEEGTDLVEGAAKASKQFTHATFRELPTEVLLDPVAGRKSALE